MTDEEIQSFVQITIHQPRYHVYILACKDGTYYVGKTRDLKDRLTRHCKKQVKYTCNRLPVKLIHYSTFFDEYQAALFEKYLKSGSGRAFAKGHLINAELM